MDKQIIKVHNINYVGRKRGMTMKCPYCNEKLTEHDVKKEIWYTFEGDKRYILVCMKCDRILGASS